MKEKIVVAIESLDDIKKVLKCLELLFNQLVCYYTRKDIKKLHILAISCGAFFGRLLRDLGYNGKDFK
jgi:hypothetical protein